MRLFSIGQADIKLHPGLIIVVFAAIVMGLLPELLLTFLALSLHEAFHAIIASSLGYRVICVELLPFGGVARLGNRALSHANDFFIALAGPLCSFLVAGCLSMAMRYFPQTAGGLDYFLQANIFLALFNLLPALPLDGGRMLRAMLTLFLRERVATLIAAYIGITLGGLIICLGAYMLYHGAFNALLFVVGIFLIIAASNEIKSMAQAKLNNMMRRRDALLSGKSLPLRHFAVSADTTAGEALRLLSSSRYNLITVLDGDLYNLGELDESTLLYGLGKRGASITLGELLKSL